MKRRPFRVLFARIPPEVHARLVKSAARHGVSLSELVAQLALAWLDWGGLATIYPAARRGGKKHGA